MRFVMAVQRLTFIGRMEELTVGLRKAAIIASELGINERVAQRWWEKYEETGKILAGGKIKINLQGDRYRIKN